MLSCCLNKWQAECCGALAAFLELDYLPSSTWHPRTVTLNLPSIWLLTTASDHAPSLPSSAFHLLHCLSIIATGLPQGPELFPIIFRYNRLFWGFWWFHLSYRCSSLAWSSGLLGSDIGQEQEQFLQALVVRTLPQGMKTLNQHDLHVVAVFK